jgi:hypothetical protein
MRTQTLLIAAATALAAAVTSSQAQTVYSANVVGYVNVTVPANSFSLIANQLDTGTNNINNVLQNGNLVSYGAAGIGQSTLLFFTGSGYNFYYYYNAADASPSPAGWYDGAGNYATNLLGPTMACFFENPASSNITVTLTGQVDQGTNTWQQVTPGFQYYSEPTALAGTPLDNTNVNFPAYDPYPGSGNQDSVQTWTGSGYSPFIYYYNAADASPSPAGWYDGGGNYADAIPSDWPNVGAGILIYHGGGTSNWVQTFEVQ